MSPLSKLLLDPALVDVQQVVLDCLAESSIHELVPLLGVNKYLRHLVTKRVVALFTRPGVEHDHPVYGRILKPRPGDGFIKTRLSSSPLPSLPRLGY